MSRTGQKRLLTAVPNAVLSIPRFDSLTGHSHEPATGLTKLVRRITAEIVLPKTDTSIEIYSPAHDQQTSNGDTFTVKVAAST